MNIFRMLGMMSGNRIEVSGDLAYDFMAVRDSSVWGEKKDINALTSVNDTMAAIMVWNYHDLNIISPDQDITISINGIPSKKVEITHFRIDQHFSNSYEKWKEIGSPQNVTEAQYKELEQSGKLARFEKPNTVRIKNGQHSANLVLPGQAASLLVLKWKK